MMAKEQRDDIRRLKHEASEKNSGPPGKRPADKAVPDPWLMHPIRRTKHLAAKATRQNATRPASKKAPKKAAKKFANKTSKKARL